MFAPLPLVIVFCLLSALAGILTALLGRSFLLRNRSGSSVNENSSDQHNLSERSEIDRRISSLYELTSQVGLQVGQHSLRVSEITDSIDLHDGAKRTLILVAGKLLITANQKLQAELEEAEREIQLQRDQMTSWIQESQTDTLTCLPNRRALDHQVIQVFSRHRRDASRFSLVIIDIDNFKRINDQHGHMVGDQLLKSLSRRLVSTFRESDFVARYGGEEFVAILPETSIEEACKTAELVRHAIAATPYTVGGLELPMTASIGVKEVARGETETILFQKVDETLYMAKNAGRNCCYYHDGTKCRRHVPAVVSTELSAESTMG